uniref:DNA mismatch repair protein MutT n=1 Tax=Mesoaciditoga lauensis TaxID=1495039 RepID=A0A7V3VS68_9BACT
MDEMVLVVQSKDIDELVLNEGFVEIPIDEIKKLVETKGFFVRREKAESDELERQIIPYVVMQNKDGLYLTVRRLNAQTEKRLHGMYSIGMGGHVNDHDEGETPWMKFLSGMEREMNEEVLIQESFGWPKYLGVIKEKSTPVNKVHLGIVFEIKADIKGIREIDKFTWEFMNLYDLLSRRDMMESWSKLILDSMNDKI